MGARYCVFTKNQRIAMPWYFCSTSRIVKKLPTDLDLHAAPSFQLRVPQDGALSDVLALRFQGSLNANSCGDILAVRNLSLIHI